MLIKLYSYLRQQRIKKTLYTNKKRIIIGDGTIIQQNAHFVLRNCTVERPFITIGKDSLLDCDFFIENGNGRISVGDRVHIGGNTKIISIQNIEIGNDVTIAWDCTLYDHNSHSVFWNERSNDTLQELEDLNSSGDFLKNKNWDVVKSDRISIKDKVWLGFNVTVLKGVTIGEGAVVGAGSVVTHDIPPYTVVAGNPARIIRKIKLNGGMDNAK